MSEISALVMSRNRPAQLDLLLTSLYRNAPLLVKNLTVLYTHDTTDFKEGYRRLRLEHPNVSFIHETNFATQVRWTLECSPTKFFMFLCDDDIFYRYLTEQMYPGRFLLAHPEVLSVSLRLGKGLKTCYSMNTPQKEPALRWANGMYVWRFPDKDGDWSYPGSLDGDVWRTNHLRVMLQGGEWRSPNELESHLNWMARGAKLKQMACYKQSLLIGNPANSVQRSVSENRNTRLESMSPERLNQLFLDGRRLRVENLRIGAVRAVHHEVDLAEEGT